MDNNDPNDNIRIIKRNFRKKKNPEDAVDFLSGGNNTGKTKTNPYFTTLGAGPDKRLAAKDTVANILSKIYTFTWNNEIRLKKLQRLEEKKFIRAEKIKNKRNTELISAFETEEYETVDGKRKTLRRPYRRIKRKPIGPLPKETQKSSSPILKAGLFALAGAGGLILTRMAFDKSVDLISEKMSELDAKMEDIKTKIDYPNFHNLIDFRFLREQVNDLGNYIGIGDIFKIGYEDFDMSGATAKSAAESYLGRVMSGVEWDQLIRATSAEAGVKDDPTEQAMIMATILNRARAIGGEESIIKALYAPKQFQSVTGTKKQPGPSEGFVRGPNIERQRSINFAATDILSKVTKQQTQFTSADPKAYKEGTNIKRLHEMLAAGGAQAGGTVFETAPPLNVPSLPKAMTLPVKNTSVKERYGMRKVHPITGEAGVRHKGIDLAAPKGTNIVAANEGVVSVGYDKVSGNYISITDNTGFTTKYMHLEEVLVKGGETVKQGQLIAKSGATGAVTGPHLHFEVLLRDKQGVMKHVDPEKFLPTIIQSQMPAPTPPTQNVIVVKKNVTNSSIISHTETTKKDTPKIIEKVYNK